MSLLQGKPLPSIKTTKEVETTGPDWYTEYLQKLAQPGTAMLAKTGEEMVAPLTDLQRTALNIAPTALTGYAPGMESAATTATEAAKGITPGMISGFMSPYLRGFTDETGTVRPGVLDEMQRLSQQSLQRNLLPTLKSAFAGTGGFGSQRMMGALGQMGADVQANLLGAQTKAIQDAYDRALQTSGTQAGLLRQAAETQRGVSTADLDAAIKALEAGYGLGTKEQQQAQAKIMAPLTAATTAANVFANLKVPSTVSEESFGPIPGAYSTSPLAQIAGLGSLFASGQGGTSAFKGITDALRGLLPSGGSGGSNDYSGPSSPEGGGGGEYAAGEEDNYSTDDYNTPISDFSDDYYTPSSDFSDDYVD